MSTKHIETFINNQVTIKTTDANYLGKLISIDGYLNCILENCTIQSDSTQIEKLLFLKGNFVEHINLI
ncbi:hypothetical protein TUBRATIS_006490 [Tubulinosema ratisbonensis]|uniref:Sm domain-containing protein n=1 Tax=Tubulinosema ratisbonensis TaxID=291195 RepID=A0A437ANS2_9MICR|nr:hypothetical protein TUBRATIS_006490 [Tubulinosema ratisbonensis]